MSEQSETREKQKGCSRESQGSQTEPAPFPVLATPTLLLHPNDVRLLEHVLREVVNIRLGLAKRSRADMQRILGGLAYLYHGKERWREDTGVLKRVVQRLEGLLNGQETVYLGRNVWVLIRDSLVLYTGLIQRYLGISGEQADYFLAVHWLREHIEEQLHLRPVD